MKRDDDYIRELLLEAEADEHSRVLAPSALNLNPEERKKNIHAKLLCDAGYFKESGRSGGIFRITNQGHDYLAAVRDEGIWKKTKERAAAAGGVTLGMMKEIATAYLKDMLGLS